MISQQEQSLTPIQVVSPKKFEELDGIRFKRNQEVRFLEKEKVDSRPSQNQRFAVGVSFKEEKPFEINIPIDSEIPLPAKPSSPGGINASLGVVQKENASEQPNEENSKTDAQITKETSAKEEVLIPGIELKSSPKCTEKQEPQQIFMVLDSMDPELLKFQKMIKCGLPQGAVENAMIRDSIHPSSIFGKDSINDPKPTEYLQSSSENFLKRINAPTSESTSNFKKLDGNSSELIRFKKMLKVAQLAIENAMVDEGIDPSSIFTYTKGVPDFPFRKKNEEKSKNQSQQDFVKFIEGLIYQEEKDRKLSDPNCFVKEGEKVLQSDNSFLTDISSVKVRQTNNDAVLKMPVKGEMDDETNVGFRTLSIENPELDKYKKMTKTGLPQGAVENAMMRDFIHPNSLFGENAINNPKVPKKLAIVGATNNTGENSTPAGRTSLGDSAKSSLMEEMRLKQEARLQKQSSSTFIDPLSNKEKSKQEDNNNNSSIIFEEIKLKSTKSKSDLGISPMKQPSIIGSHSGVSLTPTKQTSDPVSNDENNRSKTESPNKKTSMSSPYTPNQQSDAKPPSWIKKSNSATKQSLETNGEDGLVNLLQSVKLSLEDSRAHASALCKEGFDCIEKLELLDLDDLKACGITKRFDVKAILSLKSTIS